MLKIRSPNQRINRLCNTNDLSKRFLDVPGVRPLTATIVAADIGDGGKGYKSSRDYATSLGVVPKHTVVQISSIIWGSVSRGNRYIRTLLIQWCGAVLKNCGKKTDKLSLSAKSWWLGVALMKKTAVALYQQNARILWATASNGKDYEALVA